MRNTYRALLALPTIDKEHKKDAEYVNNIMCAQMSHWDSSKPVAEYPDYFINPDADYERIIRQPRLMRSIRNKMNVDDSTEILNYFGKPLGHIYYSDIPRLWKDKDNRKPSAKTKLYAYSIVNPNGMFKKWRFPITKPYNGIDIKSSKLVNKNYGTMHDLLELGNLDFESTYLPDIAFRPGYIDPETNAKIPAAMWDRGICFINENDDGEEMTLEDFLFSTMDRYNLIALVECES